MSTEGQLFSRSTTSTYWMVHGTGATGCREPQSVREPLCPFNGPAMPIGPSLRALGRRQGSSWRGRKNQMRDTPNRGREWRYLECRSICYRYRPCCEKQPPAGPNFPSAMTVFMSQLEWFHDYRRANEVGGTSISCRQTDLFRSLLFSSGSLSLYWNSPAQSGAGKSTLPVSIFRFHRSQRWSPPRHSSLYPGLHIRTH